jgi:hypothetical protein
MVIFIKIFGSYSFFIRKNVDRKLQPLFEWWSFVLFPLGVGGVFYLLFRPDTIIGFRFVDEWDFLTLVREYSVPLGENLIPFIRFRLWDGVWVFSATYGILLIEQKQRTLFFWAPLLIGLVGELLQSTGSLGGTADWGDCLVMGIGILGADAMNKYFIINEK